VTRGIVLAALLDRLAELVDDVGEPDFADLYRRHAASLRLSPGRGAERVVGRDVVATLVAGPGTLSDRYLVDDSGRPDAIRSREFVDLVATVRRRAARLARRW